MTDFWPAIVSCGCNLHWIHGIADGSCKKIAWKFVWTVVANIDIARDEQPESEDPAVVVSLVIDPMWLVYIYNEQQLATDKEMAHLL